MKKLYAQTANASLGHQSIGDDISVDRATALQEGGSSACQAETHPFSTSLLNCQTNNALPPIAERCKANSNGISANVNTMPSVSAVAARFSKAALHYDKLAAIQNTIAQQGLQNLPAKLIGNALDIGCGTGVHTQSLAERGLNVVGVDIAQGMLELASTNYPDLAFKLGSAQALPVDNDSIDIAYSSMALQWANSPICVAREIQRVLKRGANAELAIMVSGSFEELTLARKLAQLPPANTPMPSADMWERAFSGSGLVVKRLITRDYVDTYTDIMALLRSIKGVGAGETGRQQKVLRRQDIKKLSIAYHNIHSQAGRLPLTYRVCHFRLEKE